MYENPKLERLGTFRELTQDDESECELPDLKLLHLGENSEYDDNGCLTR